jgi:HSP20 family protein
MNMIKFAPTRRMFDNSFFDNFPTLFDDLLTGKTLSGFMPSVNVSETEKSWHIEVAAPGMNKENFRISLEKDMLTISAEVKTEEKKEEKNYCRREFTYGSFSRSFRVRENSVDADNIGARYENGILQIDLPKKSAEAAKNTREIRIA